MIEGLRFCTSYGLREVSSEVMSKEYGPYGGHDEVRVGISHRRSTKVGFIWRRVEGVFCIDTIIQDTSKTKTQTIYCSKKHCPAYNNQIDLISSNSHANPSLAGALTFSNICTPSSMFLHLIGISSAISIISKTKPFDTIRTQKLSQPRWCGIVRRLSSGS